MKKSSQEKTVTPLDQSQIAELFGYLNFSSGKPDKRFQSQFNQFWHSLPSKTTSEEIKNGLLSQLEVFKKSNINFAKEEQAETVIRYVFEKCIPAYRQFHSDLLFHLNEKDFLQPFFLVRVFEATLNQDTSLEDERTVVKGFSSI